MSSQSLAGEWISTQRHVICIDSTEGLGYDLQRLGKKKKGKAKMCCCNSWAPQALRFVFMWFQPANPDQTVILIGEKHPGFTFKYLWSQLLSMTDRQRHVRQASFGIMFSSAPYLRRLCRKTNNRSLNFLFFLIFLACFFIYFFKILCCCPLTGLRGSHFLGGRCSVYLPECIFKGAGEADIIPAPAALAEGESPVAPCRAAMSIVCLHTE